MITSERDTSFPHAWDRVPLCVPPADPANPAENNIEPDTADRRMFEKCAADSSEISGLVGFVGGPHKITKEISISEPQQAVDLVRRPCVGRRKESGWDDGS